MKRRIAWFISPHGFGHAARSCAVMEAVREADPDLEFDIYTSAPEWFFSDSLGSGFRYHHLVTDVGLVQPGPFAEDLPATLARLKDFLPFSPALLEKLSHQLHADHVVLVVSDISPLGLSAASQAGISSLLIENFTWDWIYSAYLDREPAFAAYIRRMAEIFQSANHRIQTAPECQPLPENGLVLPPASRNPRQSRSETREALGIDAGEPAVLVSFGGIPMSHRQLTALECPDGIHLVIPLDVPKIERRGNCLILPHHSQFYHPDLMEACDAVVGKVGYSTLAEAYRAGRPFGYLLRAEFPESSVLAAFIQQRMAGFEIPMVEFQDGSWVKRLPELLALAGSAAPGENGARRIAGRLLGWLG